MKTHATRPLKDIQAQAERLISSRISMEDLEEFARYNSELKEFYLKNEKDPELITLASGIPEILEVETDIYMQSAFALLAQAIFTLGISYLYISYLRGERKKRLILDNVRIARGIYANMELRMNEI